jgi:bifunctional non-homologous end joining protein LigD
MSPVRSARDWPIAPMKAVAGPLPLGDDWRFEPKWDGHRALARCDARGVAIVSSSGSDRTTVWAWLAETLAPLVDTSVVLDGEVIALGDDGRHQFGLVGAAGVPHAYVVFDVLAHRGQMLLDRPWAERRALLETAVPPVPQLLVTPVTEDGETLWEVTRSQSYEGVVAKRIDSRYVPGTRTRDWVKAKHRHEQEFLIVGWLPGSSAHGRVTHPERPGSLLLGVHDAGLIRFVGAAGSGLSERLVDAVLVALRGREADRPLVEEVPPAVRRRAHWVRPEAVVQIRHAGWTTGGRLRHPVVLGLRDDVDPAGVTAAP